MSSAPSAAVRLRTSDLTAFFLSHCSHSSRMLRSTNSLKSFNKLASQSTFSRVNNPSTSASTICRSFSSTSISSNSKAVPATRQSISTPIEFLASISRPPRRDLSSNSSVVSAVGEDWEKMFSLNRDTLKGAGVNIKDRRYLLWALEKFRQGLDPKDYAIEPKPKKKVRGWGPRVQNGIRVSGRKRPGEK